MAFTKEIKVDKIDIVSDYKCVHCRQVTIVKEDGVDLTRAIKRYVLEPHMDISGEPQEVQNVCNAVWTDEVKKAWNDSQAVLAAEWAERKAIAEKEAGL